MIDPMPALYRADPPLPEDVVSAMRVLGSDTMVSLIRYYSQTPGSQRQAAADLDLPGPVVTSATQTLTREGVVYGDPVPRGFRAGKWVVDRDRLESLHQALRQYLLEEPHGT